MLTPNDYKEAITIQDACNLSGVVKSFSRMMDKIWEEARSHGKGTDWVNTHPIAILFAEKCVHLTTGQMIPGTKINDAWTECEKKSEE